MARTTLARGTHVHAVAARDHLSSIADDEPTKKVPAELFALASELDDGDETDPCTPLSGIAFKALDELAAIEEGEAANESPSRPPVSCLSPSALDALEIEELEDAFASIDSLGVGPAVASLSAPASTSTAAHRSGVVPALNPLAIVKRKPEVIPPPPKRPTAIAGLSLVAPPLARPITTPMAVPKTTPSSVTAALPASAPEHALDEASEKQPEERVFAVTRRQIISRSVASAIFALFALMVLFMVGTRPDPIVLPTARYLVTINARAPMASPRRAAAKGWHAAPRPAPVTAAPVAAAPVAAAPARFAPARGPVANAPRSPAASGRIVRTAPF